jgi:ABC-type sugar transport system permease subunit
MLPVAGQAAAALLLPSLVFLLAFTYWPLLRAVAESFVVGRFADALLRPYVEQTALKAVA